MLWFGLKKRIEKLEALCQDLKNELDSNLAMQMKLWQMVEKIIGDANKQKVKQKPVAKKAKKPVVKSPYDRLVDLLKSNPKGIQLGFNALCKKAGISKIVLTNAIAEGKVKRTGKFHKPVYKLA